MGRAQNMCEFVFFRTSCKSAMINFRGSRAGLPTEAALAAKVGGARRDRTDDLLLAKQALSQLSYGPALRQPSSRAVRAGLPSRSSRQPARLRPLGSGVAATLAFRERRLVGLGRFELPTSRLSSARSNQLSYRPESVYLVRRKRNEDGGAPRYR